MPDLRAEGSGGLNVLSATEAATMLDAGRATCERLAGDCLARIEARDRDIHAWEHIDRELVLAEARRLDRQPRRGPLHGIPIGIKDIFDTYDMPTGYGSSICAGHRPAADSAIVGLLRAAGALILGKCETTEFASPVLRHTRNPHDLARSPGVSSSGSAAAVADFHVPLSVGSQTGGSTILPASFCGVVGYKASLSGLDRGGIRHLRPSLDTVGLFARTVDDIALIRTALAGRLPRPMQSRPHRRLRIGLCRTFNWSQAAPESVTALETTAARLSTAGAEIADAELPPVFAGIEDSFRIISSLEGARAVAVEARDHLDAMNDWLKAGHALAATITPDQVDAAQLHAAVCRRALATLQADFDCLITPSACGEATTDLASVSSSAFNRVWTLMHVPCVSLPAFTGPNGMPVGVQVVGPHGADDRTIAIARWIAAHLT